MKEFKVGDTVWFFDELLGSYVSGSVVGLLSDSYLIGHGGCIVLPKEDAFESGSGAIIHELNKREARGDYK